MLSKCAQLIPVKTVAMHPVNSSFKLFLTDTIATLQLAFLCGIDGGIYLSLIKENFLRDCAAIAPSKLAMRLAKQLF